MKQFEGPTLPAAPQIVNEAQQRQEYKMIGTIILQKGMKLYSFSFATMKVEEVKIKRDNVVIGQSMTKTDISARGRAEYDPRSIYLQAINMKNAVRKFNKILSRYIDPEMVAKIIEEQTGE